MSILLKELSGNFLILHREITNLGLRVVLMQIAPELLVLRSGPVENHVCEVSPVDTKLFVVALILAKIHDGRIKQWQRIKQVIIHLFLLKMDTFAVILSHELRHHFGSTRALRFDIGNNELVSY